MCNAEQPCANLRFRSPAEVQDLWRGLAVVVFPVGEDPPDSVRVPTHRELAVGTEAIVDLGHPRVRNEHRDRDLDLWIESLSVHVAAGVGDRLLEQLDVGVESDGLDVSVLRLSEQCAGAADLHVPGSDGKAGAEVRVLLEGSEAHLRGGMNGLIRGDEEGAVRAHMAPSNPSSKLVQLRHAQLVRAVHDHRVDARDVDAGLDDGRAHQHMNLPLDEVDQGPLQLPRVHLSVAHGDGRFWHQLAQSRGHGLDARDPIVDEEDLAAAPELGQDVFSNPRLVEPGQSGLDRPPIGRRCRDEAHLSQA